MPKHDHWINTLKAFTHPRVITMLFLGFSAGVPILLIFSSLSLWLREADIARSAVTYFSWAALGYSFKFVWAPLVDRLPIPWLTNKLGRRRAWILVAQLAIMVAILWMASSDPSLGQQQLTWLAMAAVLLGFSSATQDIVIDAYRIESAKADLQALMSSTYIAGYRIGMLVAGAGALFIASAFGTSKGHYQYEAWQMTYIIMALNMLIGITTTLLIKEPKHTKAPHSELNTHELLRFFALFLVSVLVFIGSYKATALTANLIKPSIIEWSNNTALAGFIIELLRLAAALSMTLFTAKAMILLKIVPSKTLDETYIEPVRDFFTRYGLKLAWLLLLLIGVYRISDIVLGVISNVFYQDLGFSKNEIASIVKSFGLLMTLAGGFVGGLLAIRFGVLRILLLGAILSAATNLLFMLLAQMGHHTPMLMLVISADNLSAGIASAAFVAFLSALTNIRFTAIQYAIFSSLMTLLPKILGGYSGSIVDALGYSTFFLLTTLIGLPVIALIWLARHQLDLKLP